jgi:hypothetical protein
MNPMLQNEPSILQGFAERVFEEHACPCTENANDASQKEDPTRASPVALHTLTNDDQQFCYAGCSNLVFNQLAAS